MIPVYNSVEFIKVTLNSVVAQEHVNLEIIIIDDGSLKQLKNYQDNRIKIYHQENKGACATRNLGYLNL